MRSGSKGEFNKYEALVKISLNRGIFIPSFEIYGGLSGFYDYGPVGTRIKNKLVSEWRRFYVEEEGALEVSTTTILPEEVLKASGHIESFADPIAICGRCGRAYRADHLLSDRGIRVFEATPVEELTRLIRENNVRCPACGGEFNTVEKHNLLFGLTVGPYVTKKKAYLRPETCQGIFILFKRLFLYNRQKLPMFTAQIGRSYRNEISPRKGVIRLREFEQMELEVFVDPENKTHPRFNLVRDEKLKLITEDGDELAVTAGESVKEELVANEMLAYLLAKSKIFFRRLGIPEERIRFRQPPKDERPFYAIDTWDTEIYTEAFGWVEVVANNDRGDHDLTCHMKLSGEDLTVRIGGREFIPHVIESSFGVDRPLYCVLENAVTDDGRGWVFLRLKPLIAPWHVFVFPLLSKPPLIKKAVEVKDKLAREGLEVGYSDTGSIGKRYARADEIGVPYCVTIDYDTFKDDTVTVRDRDTRKQVRVRVSELPAYIKGLVSG